MDAFRDFDELAATAQHIELLTRKRATLEMALYDSWEQILTRAADMQRRGRLTLDDEWRLLQSMADWHGSGYTRRWNRLMPRKYLEVKGEIMRREAAREAALLHAPNGPNGSWLGDLPVDEPPYPLNGVSVVYVLFDGANQPLYVGSTARFRTRMGAHGKQKPDARRWVAYPCRDREHAYCLEERLLAEHRLPLNRKVGR